MTLAEVSVLNLNLQMKESSPPDSGLVVSILSLALSPSAKLEDQL